MAQSKAAPSIGCGSYLYILLGACLFSLFFRADFRSSGASRRTISRQRRRLHEACEHLFAGTAWRFLLAST